MATWNGLRVDQLKVWEITREYVSQGVSARRGPDQRVKAVNTRGSEGYGELRHGSIIKLALLLA